MTPASTGRALARLISACALILLVASLLQLGRGASTETWDQAWTALFDGALWNHPPTLGRLLLGDSLGDRLGLEASRPLEVSTLIVWSVRVPRVLLALLVGINLGIAGTIFQGITRNELASPYLLGVNAGAGLAVLLVLVVLPGFGAHLPLIASLGGLAAFLLVYSIAWHHGTSSVRLVLAGVVVAAVGSSIQMGLFLLIEDLAAVHDVASWTSGTLTGADWERVRTAVPWTLLVVTLALVAAPWIDILLLGDARARALGMRTERARFLLAFLAVLAAATTIAVAGMVGFVGLIAPHVVRASLGSATRSLIIGCLFVGPALMLAADTAARLLFHPVQIPVGIVTGALGGCYFLYLMRRHRHLSRP